MLLMRDFPTYLKLCNFLIVRIYKAKQAKVSCAQKLFESISTGNVKYGVVDSYDTLLNIVMK